MHPFRLALLSTLLLALAPAPSGAQSYPSKPIKLVVPFGPGGPTDVAARVVSQVVQSGLGQSVVIENRPGAGGATGTKSVAAADPDGYTMLIGTSATLGVVPALVKNPGYDPIKSFAPVAKISDSTTYLHRAAGLPANSIKSLSPTRRPIRASSAMPRPATATRRSSPPSCCWPEPDSRPCMFLTRAAPRWSPRC
jgi:tripartite-type tricarboxylate transporter receptor subunit TctC